MKSKTMLIIMSLLVIGMAIIVLAASTGIFDITFTSPLNNSNYTVSYVTLEWSINNTPEWCAYSLDGGANTTGIIFSGLEMQESANVSTTHVNIANGTYSIGTKYIYINYTKPPQALNSSLWQIKHGGTMALDSGYEYNVSIPIDCWNNSNTLQFRAYSFTETGGSLSESYGQCYNGTSWENITNIYTGAWGGISYSTPAPPNAFLDGNWSTRTTWYEVENDWVYVSGYSADALNGILYQEAMWWNLSGQPYPVTLTNLIDKVHNITIYCNDSSGNIAQSDYIYFNVSSTEIIINSSAGATNFILYNITETNESLSEENISFSSRQSILKYFSIPKYSNVTYAVLNITGFETDTQHLEGYYGDWALLANAEDNDWDTFTQFFGTNWGNFTVNHSIDTLSGISLVNWTHKISSNGAATEIDVYCYNYTISAYSKLVDYTGTFDDTYTTTLPSECYSSSPISLRAYGESGGFKNVRYYEGNLIFIAANLKSINVTIDMGSDGDIEFNHTLNLTTTNQTIDFASEVNDFLSTCSVDTNTRCNFPVNITSTNGKILIDTINLSYDYNVSHAFQFNNSYTWNTTDSIIPNTKYKRRYSIHSTSDLASETFSLKGYYNRNWTASSCEVNNVARTVTNNYCVYSQTVTRGESWPTTYIWDSNVSGGAVGNISINMTNVSVNVGDTIYENYSLFYRDANDLSSEASAGTYTNVTISGFLNYSVGTHQKIEVYNSTGGFSDITPTYNKCPELQKIIADSRTFYTCLNISSRPNPYVIKIETSN